MDKKNSAVVGEGDEQSPNPLKGNFNMLLLKIILVHYRKNNCSILKNQTSKNQTSAIYYCGLKSYGSTSATFCQVQ